MPTRRLFNPATQRDEAAECYVDNAGEIIATFADGGFVKFPASLSGAQFDDLIRRHKEANWRGDPGSDDT